MKEDRKYEDYRWGEPPPSKRQFGYAVSLGVRLKDGMNRFQVSDAIDRLIAAKSPATREQLQAIRRLGGTLPREITQAEGEAILDLLERVVLKCRHCRAPVAIDDQECLACGAKQPRRKFRIAFNRKGQPILRKPRTFLGSLARLIIAVALILLIVNLIISRL